MGMMSAFAVAMQAGAQIGAGRSAKRAANIQAQQLDIAGGQEIAASHRSAEAEEHRARLLASRALAVAGASGGGVSDPTVVDIVAGIFAEGEYRSDLALYEGQERARAMRLKGEAARTEGKSKESAGYIGAATTIANYYGKKTMMEGGTSLYEKYGRGGPPERFG